ncbi:MAG: cupin domain-containing protein [Methanoregulaceae archaeon]
MQVAGKYVGEIMIIRDIAKTPSARVMDRSILAELLHPDKVSGAGNLGCSIAHAVVPTHESTLPHRLNRSMELYYILQGSGKMHIGSEQEAVGTGQIILIPPGSTQWITNTGPGDLVFLCIVSPRWRESDEELVKG